MPPPDWRQDLAATRGDGERYARLLRIAPCRERLGEKPCPAYPTDLMVTVVYPPGVSTVVVSPARLPRNALPIGDSVEIRFWDGLASMAPTRVYTSSSPPK